MTKRPPGLSARATPSKTGWIGLDVLDRQHARRGVERILVEKAQFPRVGDVILDGGIAALPGDGDELAGGVDARHFNAPLVQQAREHALAGGDVEHCLARLGMEQSHDAGQDHFAVIFAAGLADELVVPLGDAAPVGSGFWPGRLRFQRRVRLLPALLLRVWFSRGHSALCEHVNRQLESGL
jgi:hypothetical protein